MWIFSTIILIRTINYNITIFINYKYSLLYYLYVFNYYKYLNKFYIIIKILNFPFFIGKKFYS